MKLSVLLLIVMIKFSEEKPTATTLDPSIITTTESIADIENQNETSTEFVIIVPPAPEEEGKTVSTSDNGSKNSSDSNDDPPKDVQLPVDLLTADILLDPSVILARAERSADLQSLESVSLPKQISDSLNIGNQFPDGIPTYYFVKFVRVPRSLGPRLVPERINEHFRMPEQQHKTIRRFSRSTTDEGADKLITKDLHTADDGFIIRPLFKYRHEQLKKSNRGYRNRDSYSYYPRYPIFPGK